MTPNQNRAVWELCRQGLHGIAEQAEMAWGHGEHLDVDQRAPLAREISHLIKICNWEARAQEARSAA
jgi:hypothetical protein